MRRPYDDPKGEWEGYGDHRARIERELAEAKEKNLCAVIVNDEWAHGYTKRKVCRKKLTPDAEVTGIKLCGVHLRQHLKGEKEEAAENARRAEAKKAADRRKLIDAAKDAQEKAIQELLVRKGLKDVSLYGHNVWNKGKRTREWIIQIPLDVVWKLIDELPMITPDEAGEIKQRELEEAEAAQLKDATKEVPF